MLSALAAALGLVFSGIVAWSSVTTTRQQIEQERRSQASQVSFWSQPGGLRGEESGTEDVTIISNRSVDVITQVDMLFRVPPFDGDEKRYAALGIEEIPPCTRITFPDRLLGNLIREMEYNLSGATRPRGIQFYDSNGMHWVREETLESRKVDTDAVGPWSNYTPEVKIEPARYCDV
ncbi:hypothetical protein GCM10010303_20410 [Streptomyces purpurascens]|nr:hypothetical protein GCM10010303_20410 [Streptomyces purpurascens]